jgi:hypothetical protein
METVHINGLPAEYNAWLPGNPSLGPGHFTPP